MVNEDAIKHLEFIQSVISRMASNSFLLKGWTVTLVAALFALAAQNSNADFIYLAVCPIISFWILDAYYLRQERFYRALYNDIRKKEESIIDPFTMDTHPFEVKEKCYIQVMFSKTLGIFYLTIFITVAIMLYAIEFKP